MINVAKAPIWPPSLAASPPTMVPSRIARNVAPSTRALPAGSSSRARWSGRMPYLIGPNSAAMMPIRNSATNRMGTECQAKPTTATAATPISASLRRCAMIALSKRSASCPPRPERKKYGRMKTEAASVINASAFSPPILNRIRKTSEFLRKLSLKAEKNWHQNSGAKRRVVISEVDIEEFRSARFGRCPLWLSRARLRSGSSLAEDCGLGVMAGVSPGAAPWRLTTRENHRDRARGPGSTAGRSARVIACRSFLCKVPSACFCTRPWVRFAKIIRQ